MRNENRIREEYENEEKNLKLKEILIEKIDIIKKKIKFKEIWKPQTELKR